jgi:hypothetical protein
VKEIVSKILSSLDNHSKGYSARKLSALVIIICVISAHIKWITLGDFSQLEMVLTIDYAFISTMLGLTTYQAIKTKDEKPTDNP